MKRTHVAGVVLAAVLVAAASAPAGAAATAPRDPTRFACPSGLDGSFTDAVGSVHETAIECLEVLGVVAGTSATTYSPSAPVTRGQLASLLARAVALSGTAFDITDAGFTDLGGSVHTDAINALANAGVVSGKTETTFAPDAPVTRAQAASMVARTEGEPSGQDPDAFVDDEGSVAHEAAINALAAVGIVSGVTADRFDPDGTLSRGAAASVLARTLDFAVEVGAMFPPFGGAGFGVALSGASEVPGPGDPSAFGSAFVFPGGLPGMLCVEWDIDGPLSSPPTAAHIHVGAPGAAGPIVVALPTPMVGAGERLFSQGCVSGLDPTAIDSVLANPTGHYVNVHTEAHPDGAIRGQLAELGVPLGTVLTGAEEAPGPGEAGAGGAAGVESSADNRILCVFVEYEGTETPTAAHIHKAAPGAAGPIVVPFPPFDAEAPIADGCIPGLDPTLIADIGANPGDYYVNVHTDGHPDGAVRGQLSRRTFFETSLTGAGEVPGPGDPDGSGNAFLEIISGGLACVDLSARNLDRVTMAHIHEGPPGVAGPIVVPLPAPVFGRAGDCITVDPALAADIAANPAEYYVNVHTAAFPAGAIRGQLAAAP